MTLTDFIRESNRIEGYRHEPTDREIHAHRHMLLLKEIRVGDLENFVNLIQPGAALRHIYGMNVTVGDHTPPPGGPEIRQWLKAQLDDMTLWERDNPALPRRCKFAYDWHHKYETLHPFMDGNGRSGRILWLRQMGGVENAPLGFLHHWYYQSLQFSRAAEWTLRNPLTR